MTSVDTILSALKIHEMQSCEVQKATGLKPRTVRYALKHLWDVGKLMKRFDVSDMRSPYYSVRVK